MLSLYSHKMCSRSLWFVKLIDCGLLNWLNKGKHNLELSYLFLAEVTSLSLVYIYLIYMFFEKTYFLLTWFFMGSVLIWHMYSPESFLLTLLMVSSQVLWSEWITDMRLLWVMTRLWMASIAFVSALIHATWIRESREEITRGLEPR